MTAGSLAESSARCRRRGRARVVFTGVLEALAPQGFGEGRLRVRRELRRGGRRLVLPAALALIDAVGDGSKTMNEDKTRDAETSSATGSGGVTVRMENVIGGFLTRKPLTEGCND